MPGLYLCWNHHRLVKSICDPAYMLLYVRFLTWLVEDLSSFITWVIYCFSDIQDSLGHVHEQFAAVKERSHA